MHRAYYICRKRNPNTARAKFEIERERERERGLKTLNPELRLAENEDCDVIERVERMVA